jgi:hypothetical protein
MTSARHALHHAPKGVDAAATIIARPAKVEEDGPLWFSTFASQTKNLKVESANFRIRVVEWHN